MELNASHIDDFVRRLHEQRSNILVEYRNVLDTDGDTLASGDGADEIRAKLERMDADVKRIDDEIKSWQDRARIEREADEARAAYEPFLRPAADEKRSVEQGNDMLRFLRGEIRHVDLDMRSVIREKQLIRAGASPEEVRSELRDLSKTAAAGGNTVPTSFLRELYDHLEVYSAMRRVGATVISTPGGESLEIPKASAHGTAAIVGEGTAMAEADPAFGKVTLGAWKAAQLIQITQELLQDSGVNILSFIARDAGRAIGRLENTWFTTGSGTNQPLGITIAAGTGVTAAAAGTGIPTADNLFQLLYSVNSEYRMQPSCVWQMVDTSISFIRRLKDSNNQYLWQPGLQLGEPDRLLGYRVVENPAVKAFGTANNQAIIFGDHSAYYIRDAGAWRFERSDEFAFSSDLVTFRSVRRTDGDLVDLTGAVKVFDGGTS